MRSFVNGDAYLDIDMSDLARTVNKLSTILTEQQLEKLMHRTFKEVGERGKTPIAKEVSKDYAVTQKWVRSGIEKYELGYGLNGVSCTIPLSSKKGSIGGLFKASGGGERKIKAAIVRAHKSTLPDKMKNQGGNPPFMANGIAYTRRKKTRFPIVRVVGLGVPQMPLNLSEDKVKTALLELADKRLEHNLIHLFDTGFK